MWIQIRTPIHSYWSGRMSRCSGIPSWSLSPSKQTAASGGTGSTLLVLGKVQGRSERPRLGGDVRGTAVVGSEVWVLDLATTWRRCVYQRWIQGETKGQLSADSFLQPRLGLSSLSKDGWRERRCGTGVFEVSLCRSKGACESEGAALRAMNQSRGSSVDGVSRGRLLVRL